VTTLHANEYSTTRVLEYSSTEFMVTTQKLNTTLSCSFFSEKLGLLFSKMMSLLRLRIFAFAVLVTLSRVQGIPEPKTGLDFPAKYLGSALSKLGVRTKGPIKVYAVGQYGETFLLKMNMQVGAEKMASALSDALKPRCSDKECIEKFKTMMMDGLPKGCGKGMNLAFATKGGKVAMIVNNKAIGNVASKPLAKAFIGIYCDSKAVCKLNSV
jgi:hypothetical protein